MCSQQQGPLCLLLLLAGFLFTRPAADAAEKPVLEQQVYAERGLQTLIPGVEMALEGHGYLEWNMVKMGHTQRQSILSYHYGSAEAEIQHQYERRVRFFKNASIVLHNATHEDSGLYILQLKLKDEKRVRVTVLDPISKIDAQKTVSSLDCSLRMTCEASGDVSNITWLINGVEVTQNFTHVGNCSVLEISADSQGTYTCVASNPISKRESQFTVAHDGYAILCVVCFLIAALVFSLPLSISKCCSMMCPGSIERNCTPIGPVNDVCAVACWALYLFCSLISTIVGHAFPAAYGHPVFNAIFMSALVICLFVELVIVVWQKLKPKEMCSCTEDVLKTPRMILHFSVWGGSWFTLLYYFINYVSACGRHPHFAWAIWLAAAVPVIVCVVMWCCCCCRAHAPSDDRLKEVFLEGPVNPSPAD
ncbi:uncharacterized protein [Ambystoma mexicanum]|uniref:uncharacterized protein n=1 Tax=Ambystoma mexicanum TaxID=8296 RepID=UPI0037E8F6EB